MTTALSSIVARRRSGAALAGTALVTVPALAWILDPYQLTVATTALVAATLAASAQLLTGIAGLPTLGQAVYFGVGAYTAALCARTTSLAPAQLAAAVAAAAVAAAVVGPALVRTRGLAFLLATLATAELGRTAAENSTITGGGNGLAAPASVPLPGLPPLTGDRATYLYALAVVALLVGAAAWLVRTRFGLVLRGIADHEARTEANGINIHIHLWVGFVVAAAVAGAAGGLHIASRGYVSPSDLGVDVSALALLAAVIGRRSILGACLAAAAIVAARDVVGNLLPGHTPTLLGLLFVAAAFAHHRMTTSSGRRPRSTS